MSFEIASICSFFLILNSVCQGRSDISEISSHEDLKVKWTGQGSLLLEGEKCLVWIDPYNLGKDCIAPVDYILITHSHSDHLSAKDISKIFQPGKTRIIAPADVVQRLNKSFSKEAVTISADESLEYEGVIIDAVKAYTVSKSTHPEKRGWLGFVVTLDSVKYYYVGDSEFIPEMEEIDCDVIFTPLGQKFTMNSVEDAVKAVLASKAEIAVPVHYGMYEGMGTDADAFVEIVEEREGIKAFKIPLLQ